MQIRKAIIKDTDDIFALIENFSDKKLMLPKTLSDIYDALRDFVVIEVEGKVMACGALKLFWKDLAEIRSLAVDDNFQHQGCGKRIVEFLLQEAKSLGIFKVFTLSYQVKFFEKQGFTLIKKEDLPQKIWRDCYKCPKFPCCDENALIINL